MNAFRDTRVLTEAALAIALAFVLGLIKVFKMPYGGSISLEMVPLILLALRQGPWVGIVSGVVYSFLNLLSDPQVFHPIQVLFDYPLAFGVLGLAGFFRPTVRGGPLSGPRSPSWRVLPATSSPAWSFSPPTRPRAGTPRYLPPRSWPPPADTRNPPA